MRRRRCLPAGRVNIFYGNRGTTPLLAVTARAFHPTTPDALKLQLKPIDSTIGPGQQVTQQLQVECVTPFAAPPVLEVSLSYQGRPVLLALKLPVTLNKFVAQLPAQLNSDTFFQKWNQLGGYVGLTCGDEREE